VEPKKVLAISNDKIVKGLEIMSVKGPFSVLLPVRNGGVFLQDALDSILTQTLLPCEIVLIDDGSTDSTGHLLNLFKKQNDKKFQIKIVRTLGVGIASALNTGMEHVSCDWVARLDADDICAPRRFELQWTAASGGAVDLWSCQITTNVNKNCDAITNAGMQRFGIWSNSILSHHALERAMWIDSPLPHPTWFLRTATWRTVGPYSLEEIPEDYEWLHRFFLMGFKAEKIPANLILWRDHSTRLTRTHAAYADDKFVEVKRRFVNQRLKTTGKTRLWFFGLGPTGKRIFTMVMGFGWPIGGVVDVSPKRIGMAWNGFEIQSPVSWSRQWRSESDLVLIGVGTAEQRAACESFCRENGLSESEYLALS